MNDDPARVSRMTVTELAERAGVSSATVIRAARRLGFDGYPHLRYALAAEAGRASSSTRPEIPKVADIVDADDPATIVGKLAAYESNQLLATAGLLSPSGIEEVSSRVVAARRHFVFGIGSSGLVAQDLAQKFGRLGLTSIASVEHDGSLVAATLLTSTDVVLAISHSGETPGTLEPARSARATGAYLAVITGSPHSTLARLGDRVLLTADVELGPRSAAVGSRTSQLLVVDALFVRAAQLAPGGAEALRATHDAIASARKRRGR